MLSNRFIVTPSAIVHVDKVSHIDLSRVKQAIIVVHYDGVAEEVTGALAINVLMQLRPSALEGRRLRWAPVSCFCASPVVTRLMLTCKRPRTSSPDFLPDPTVPVANQLSLTRNDQVRRNGDDVWRAGSLS